jgi:hypothetical protein
MINIHLFRVKGFALFLILLLISKNRKYIIFEFVSLANEDVNSLAGEIKSVI